MTETDNCTGPARAGPPLPRLAAGVRRSAARSLRLRVRRLRTVSGPQQGPGGDDLGQSRHTVAIQAIACLAQSSPRGVPRHCPLPHFPECGDSDEGSRQLKLRDVDLDPRATVVRVVRVCARVRAAVFAARPLDPSLLGCSPARPAADGRVCPDRRPSCAWAPSPASGLCGAGFRPVRRRPGPPSARRPPSAPRRSLRARCSARLAGRRSVRVAAAPIG